MKGREYFQRMFAYDYWANKATLHSITELLDGQERPLTLLAHILGAQKIWHHRLTGEDVEGLMVWPVIHDSDYRRQVEECHGYWWEFLNNIDEDELNDTVDYANTKGQEFENTVADILSHVLMHSAYHRAQIASAVKAEGGIPAATDFIAYARTPENVLDDDDE